MGILKRPRSSRAKFTLMAQQGELVFAIPTFSGITGSDAGSAVDRRCAENRIRLFRYAQSPILKRPRGSRTEFTLVAQQGEPVFAIPTFSGITGSDACRAADRRCAENRI